MNEELLTLKELCSQLSVSVATGKNWIKLGKIAPYKTEDKTAFFTRQYADDLKNDIKSGRNAALKSRRNKKYVSGNGLYNSYVSDECKSINAVQKLLSLIDEKNIELSAGITELFIADCALRLFADKKGISGNYPRGLFQDFLRKEISFGDNDKLIESLISDREYAEKFYSEHPLLFGLDYFFEKKEDVLGLIYISCKNRGKRKATGAYFTSNTVVKKLIRSLGIKGECKVLDPCCGTGNFLLQLPDSIGIEDVYGKDIDPISVKIVRINMALKYDNAEYETICEHITEENYLTENSGEKYDYIIGNPPWGYEFSDEEKAVLRERYSTAAGKNIESYDVFIEKALSDLKTDGYLAYVLPEALLNVKAHMPVRQHIMEHNSISQIEYLGDIFDGVQCPCIDMSIRHTGEKLSTVGLKIKDGAREFLISTERQVSAEYFSFTTTDEEYEILRKVNSLDNNVFLAGNADFALGIVTGNNKEYISEEKHTDNEMVLKGSDICKYHINDVNNYIVFKPESFQQVAPVQMYRAKEKLLYRFICNQLVFAYDDRQTLSLNSCNIVIPHVDGIAVKYILAVLNSRIAQFIYKKQFNSVKVLRSHIESIPIPRIDDAAQEKVILLTDKLICGCEKNEAELLYDELDQMIAEIFGLSEKEYDIIKNTVDVENKFLVL